MEKYFKLSNSTLPTKNLKTVVTLVHSESTGPCQLIELHTSIYNPWCFATLATSYIYVGEELLPGECANIAVATSCKTHHTHSQKCGLLLMQPGGAAAAHMAAASAHCSAGRRRNRDSLPRSCLEAFLPTPAATARRAAPHGAHGRRRQAH